MKILLGVSGGLDSSFSAFKLIGEGHEVVGAILVMHENPEIDSAREVCDSFGIPLVVLDVREKFENTVVRNFIDEYRVARTPNPCVICNSEVKFRALYDYAMENGFDAIATGHYASVVSLSDGKEERYAISRSCDTGKDQTYVLWRLSQDILSKLIFPLSNMKKSEVRELAKISGIKSAEKKESQEICFIPSNDHAAFIEDRIGKCEEGNFIDETGRVIDRHKGIIRYTVGQRKGLGVALGQRAFITKIDPVTRNITLSTTDPVSTDLYVENMVFSGMSGMKIGESAVLSVKLRYLAPPVKCSLTYLGAGRGRVALFSPVRAVTPGQSAVFYDGDRVLLGGFISLI